MGEFRRYILTGAPGSGKTALIRALEARGEQVVEEAATDVIALEQARGVDAPWARARFIDDILALQARRQARAPAGRVFFDRSPFCTLALCRFLGFAEPPALGAELARLRSEGFYRPEAFLAAGLGFITPTAARRIGPEEARRFEQVHRDVYREHGFVLVEIAPGPVDARAAAVLARAA